MKRSAIRVLVIAEAIPDYGALRLHPGCGATVLRVSVEHGEKVEAACAAGVAGLAWRLFDAANPR